MIFTISMMRHLCLLTAVFMLALAIGRGIDDEQRTQEERALFMEDNPEIERRRGPKVTTKSTARTAPKVTTNPAVTTAPEVKTQPTVTTQPTVATKPNVTTAPKVTAKPEVTTKPNVTTAPKVTTKPEVTTKPNVTTAPKVTTKPEVTTKPNVTTAPKVSAKPEVTTKRSHETTRNLILKGRHICGQQPRIRSKRHAPNRRVNVAELPDDMDKVLGGINTVHGDVPWHASIYSAESYLCGGAILSQHWIVTTAYCVQPLFARNLSVVVGDHSVKVVDPGEQSFIVAQTVLHPNYTVGSYAYDIALLKIEPINGTGIQYNNYVQPICLPRVGEVVLPGHRLGVSGWGYIFDDSTGEPTSTVLVKGEIEGISHQKCQELLPHNHINLTMDCAIRVHGVSLVCHEDFGEAATMRLGGCQVLIGLILSTTGCLNLKAPVVLIKVVDFVSWIEQTTVADGDVIDTVRLDGTSWN